MGASASAPRHLLLDFSPKTVQRLSSNDAVRPILSESTGIYSPKDAHMIEEVEPASRRRSLLLSLSLVLVVQLIWLNLAAEATSAPAAVPFFNAAVDTGLGEFSVVPTFKVAIPANTIADTYTSTLTVTLVSGP
jgi:hypothetical protein